MECSAGLVFFMQEVMRLKKTSQTTDLVLALFLYIPVIWAALLIAQSLGGGLPELLSNLTAALEQPFQIQWTDKSLLSILVCTGAYLMGLCLYASGQGRTRDGEEHGSAAWGSPRQLNAQFRQKENKILTRHVRLGLDTHKHRRSLNVLVIGGSGAAKTRGYVKPNILEANSNYVITDPKMEVLTATGGYLKRQGYDIRVLNLVDLSQSDGYNPFRYLRDEKDALKLVNTLIQATTPKGSHESDPFWSKSETALLQAIILMLFQEAPEYEQNFSMVLRVLEYAEVKEDDDEYVSPLDLLFRAMEYENPESVALRQYKVFKQAAGKTAKSILVSAAVRLAPFNLPQIKAVTDHDDMDLYTLGERKCALYAVIPDNDTTFTFLVSLLYSQIFQTLYYCADQIHHGALPCHVHFILDEAPSVNLPGLPRELATMRSRNISCSTIIQNMALMTGAFRVAQGMVTTIMDSSGLTAMSATTLPDELVSVIEDVGFIDSIPLWAVTLLGSLFIWVLSLVMILTVYSRFFKLYIATAIAPIPLASFAGQPSSSIGVAFLKSYAAICLEGCVIVLACVIFSAFASSPPAIADDTLAAATIVWNYVGELIFNMLVLVGAIKMSDRIIRELMDLG